MESLVWTMKPAKLNTTRHFPACGMILDSIEEDSYLVVIGGKDVEDGNPYSNTTELIKFTAQDDIADLLETTSFWQNGPHLPYKLGKAASATTPDKKKLILAGGEKLDDLGYMTLADILLLQCLNHDCYWEKWGQLDQPRYHTVALILPGHLEDICA